MARRRLHLPAATRRSQFGGVDDPHGPRAASGRARLASTAAPIARDPLLGHPQPLRPWAALPEYVDGHTPARIPVAADAQPARCHLIEQALSDADGHVLMEATMVPERT